MTGQTDLAVNESKAITTHYPLDWGIVVPPVAILRYLTFCRAVALYYPPIPHPLGLHLGSPIVWGWRFAIYLEQHT